MRISLVAVAALVAAAPGLAAPAPPISIKSGEAASIQFDEKENAGPVQRSAAQWTPFDVQAARQLSNLPTPDAPVPVGSPMRSTDGSKPEPIPAGVVRVRFLTIADRQAMLVVENGTNRALSYRARMTTDGKTRSTDVCIVTPHMPSYEHWPHTIEKLELSDFRFVDWPEGRAPTCE